MTNSNQTSAIQANKSTLIFVNNDASQTNQFTLSNKVDSVVAFKLQTNAPRRYSVKPSHGVLYPGMIPTIVNVEYSPVDAVENGPSTDKFLIRFIYPVSNESLETLSLKELFDTTPKKHVHKLMIQVQFDPPLPASSISAGGLPTRDNRLKQIVEDLMPSSKFDDIMNMLVKNLSKRPEDALSRNELLTLKSLKMNASPAIWTELNVNAKSQFHQIRRIDQQHHTPAINFSEEKQLPESTFTNDVNGAVSKSDLDNRIMLANLLITNAKKEFDSGNIEESNKIFKTAIKSSRKSIHVEDVEYLSKMSSIEATALMGLANNYEAMKDYDQAYDNYLAALPIYMDLNDIVNEAAACGYIANIFISSGYSSTAVAWLSEQYRLLAILNGDRETDEMRHINVHIEKQMRINDLSEKHKQIACDKIIFVRAQARNDYYQRKSTQHADEADVPMQHVVNDAYTTPAPARPANYNYIYSQHDTSRASSADGVPPKQVLFTQWMPNTMSRRPSLNNRPIHHQKEAMNKSLLSVQPVSDNAHFLAPTSCSTANKTVKKRDKDRQQIVINASVELEEQAVLAQKRKSSKQVDSEARFLRMTQGRMQYLQAPAVEDEQKAKLVEELKINIQNIKPVDSSAHFLSPTDSSLAHLSPRPRGHGRTTSSASEPLPPPTGRKVSIQAIIRNKEAAKKHLERAERARQTRLKEKTGSIDPLVTSKKFNPDTPSERPRRSSYIRADVAAHGRKRPDYMDVDELLEEHHEVLINYDTPPPPPESESSHGRRRRSSTRQVAPPRKHFCFNIQYQGKTKVLPLPYDLQQVSELTVRDYKSFAAAVLELEEEAANEIELSLSNDVVLDDDYQGKDFAVSHGMVLCARVLSSGELAERIQRQPLRASSRARLEQCLAQQKAILEQVEQSITISTSNNNDEGENTKLVEANVELIKQLSESKLELDDLRFQLKIKKKVNPKLFSSINKDKVRLIRRETKSISSDLHQLRDAIKQSFQNVASDIEEIKNLLILNNSRVTTPDDSEIDQNSKKYIYDSNLLKQFKIYIALTPEWLIEDQQNEKGGLLLDSVKELTLDELASIDDQLIMPSVNNHNIEAVSDSMLHLRNPGKHAQQVEYHFDKVFASDAPLLPLLSVSVMDLIDKTLTGHNSSIILSGSKESGKDYLMYGNNTNINSNFINEIGVINRVVKHLFAAVHAAQDSLITVSVNVVELNYVNNKITDLILSNKKRKATSYKSPVIKVRSKHSYVSGVTGVKITSLADFQKVFDISKKHQISRANDSCHTMVVLSTAAETDTGEVYTGTLNFIDLNFACGLNCLTEVLCKLETNSLSHDPFEPNSLDVNSLLQDAISFDHTVLLGMIHPNMRFHGDNAGLLQILSKFLQYRSAIANQSKAGKKPKQRKRPLPGKTLGAAGGVVRRTPLSPVRSPSHRPQHRKAWH